MICFQSFISILIQNLSNFLSNPKLHFMRPKTCFNVLTALLAICIFFAYCKKGDTGPAGATGPAGPTGATGSQGAKGDTGTANVIYSAWLDVAYLPDTFRAAGNVLDTAGFFANIPAVKLTNAILTSGEMKVYFNVSTSATPSIISLPYYDVYTDYSIIPRFLLQRIGLYSDINPSTYTQNSLKYQQYRYILIPGGVLGRMSHPVDLNDYNKVKEYYNIQD